MKRLLCWLLGHDWQPHTTFEICEIRCPRCGARVDLLSAQSTRRVRRS